MYHLVKTLVFGKLWQLCDGISPVSSLRVIGVMLTSGNLFSGLLIMKPTQFCFYNKWLGSNISSISVFPLPSGIEYQNRIETNLKVSMFKASEHQLCTVILRL